MGFIAKIKSFMPQKIAITADYVRKCALQK
jgi:hypothetical protein